MGTSPDVAEAMPLKETPEKMALEKNDEDDANKGGLISESFSLSKSPKISAKSVLWAVSTEEKIPRREILAQVKKFLRLSHLYSWAKT